MAKMRDHRMMERRRRRAARMFDEGLPVPVVAHRVGVARQVVYRWREVWKAGGVAALASKGPAGRKPKLVPVQREQVVEALLKGPAAQGYKTQLWTLPRVAALIQELTGVEYHPGHVWRVLRALGFSCQRPERRALERNERGIRQWKRVTWPAIKKKPAAKAGSLSLSMRAG